MIAIEPKKIKYNELYTEKGIYNSIHTLPKELKIENSKNTIRLRIVGGILLLFFSALFLFLNNPPVFSNFLIILIGILGLSLIGTAVYSIYYRVNISINHELIEFDQIKIKWEEAGQPEELNFSGPLAMQIHQIIIRNKVDDEIKIEFQCNNLNYSESDIKQLVYLYWKTKNQ